MDFIDKLNSKNLFGIASDSSMNSGINAESVTNVGNVKSSNNKIVNIICGILVIILIVVLLYCFFKKSDKFSNKVHNENNNVNNSKNNNQVVLLHKSGCPYSEQMLKLLQENGMKIKDLEVIVMNINEDGKDLASKYNASGTPTLINDNKKTVAVGLQKDLDKLYDTLNNDNNNENDENNNNENNNNDEIEIVMIGNPSCPFCVKMKKLLDEKLGENKYNIIHSNTDIGKKYLSENDMNGVPLTINIKNGKTIKGYSENLDNLF